MITMVAVTAIDCIERLVYSACKISEDLNFKRCLIVKQRNSMNARMQNKQQVETKQRKGIFSLSRKDYRSIIFYFVFFLLYEITHAFYRKTKKYF